MRCIEKENFKKTFAKALCVFDNFEKAAKKNVRGPIYYPYDWGRRHLHPNHQPKLGGIFTAPGILFLLKVKDRENIRNINSETIDKYDLLSPDVQLY